MVYVFLAPGFETIEALTQVDYLRRAKVEVKTVAVTDNGEKTVVSAQNIPVMADMHQSEITMDGCQMVVLPGGMPGTLNLEASEVVQNALDYCVKNNIPAAAICAAPSVFGHKGMLDGKKATCYPGFDNQLGTAVHTGAPAETDGNIITGRSAGAANQFAFALIEKLCGKEMADKIKESVVY